MLNVPPPIVIETRPEVKPVEVDAVECTPTTLFSDCPIAPTEEYNKIIDPERRKLLFILAMYVVLAPLMFRYITGSSNTQGADSSDVRWASDVDSWEWAILVVLWLGLLGSIMRLLPMVAGRPAAVQSSQKCVLDGIASLGLCSPFSSEDDAILLRSLLGRTCTAFHTVGSRHSCQGLYVDTVLNERRIKGEAYRRNVWISWMKFLNSLIDVCLLIKEEQAKEQEDNLENPSPTKGYHGDDNDLYCASVDTMAPHRALYVEGMLGKRGISATKLTHQNSFDSQSGSFRTVRVPATFRDMGAVFEASAAVSDAQHQRLKEWAQEPTTSEPLSTGMALASPFQRGPLNPRGGLRGSASMDYHSPEKRLRPVLSKIIEAEDEGINGVSMYNVKAGVDRGLHRIASEDSDIGDIDEELGMFSGDIEMTGLNLDHSDITLERLSDGTHSSPRLSTGSPRYAAVSSHEHSIHSAARSPRTAAPGSVTQRVLNALPNLAVDILDPSTWFSPASVTKERSFSVAPTPRARCITPRQAQVAASYTRPHGLPNLELDMADLVPMIGFLDAWLAEMQENEWTYDYHNPKSAIEKLFFASPFMHHFKGPHMVAVHAALDALYSAFSTPLKDEPDPKLPFHPDEVSEVEWVLKRDNLPNWTVLWSFAGRARLREMKRENINDPHGPDAVYQSTRIKPGAIVYQKPHKSNMPEYIPLMYFRNRQKLMKVDHIKKGTKSTNYKDIAYLLPFPAPPKKAADAEMGEANKEVADVPIHNILPVEELSLIEMNRGKTGALNFFNDYLRAKTARWSRSLGMTHSVQTFVGIVDARHALVETDVFWNDALPYFSKLEPNQQQGERMGSLTANSLCITVQYPQFFSNIGSDDVLDNSNSTYYNLWQTLRDGAKCICSSGTNAIWDISNPNFEFCTLSRSEDLGTSHEYIPHCAAIYLCVNVALGIAKKTEDFLEALYRWSAGPLELLWPSFFIPKILKHFIKVAIPVTVMAMASFHYNPYWYFAYLFMVLLFVLAAFLDKRAGRKPLRSFIVSTVVSINLFIVCSNLMSVTWFIVFPARIAFYGILPMGRADQQGLFWGWISLFVSLPTGIMHDSLIRMARYTAPATMDMNYHKCLWRGGQLYANSFMFTALASIAGTYSAYKAWMYDYDLSMWSSFRVADSEFDKITASMKTVSVCSTQFWYLVYQYAALYLNSCLAALTMPTVMTKWYVTAIFLFQFVCIFVSTFIVNRDQVLKLVVVLFVCSLNILSTMEVALLLQPIF
eukprot:gene14583-16739_t